MRSVGVLINELWSGSDCWLQIQQAWDLEPHLDPSFSHTDTLVILAETPTQI